MTPKLATSSAETIRAVLPVQCAPPELATCNVQPATTAASADTQYPSSGAELRRMDATCNTLDFRSSDQTLDRYQEIISVAGWKLDNYRKNPVVQNAHSYWSLADTIGKALITEIRSDAPTLGRSDAPTPYLFQRIQFAVEENPMARLAYGLYKGGFLNAVSVGFIPIRWENGTAEAGYRRKYLEQELLEVSAVSIPANPNALALGLRAGAIEKGGLEELVELLRTCRKGETRISRGGVTRISRIITNSEEEGRARGGGGEEGQWLQLARQLEQIRGLLKRA